MGGLEGGAPRPGPIQAGPGGHHGGRRLETGAEVVRALRPGDDRSAFRCGGEALDWFFHRFAGRQLVHAAACYRSRGQGRVPGALLEALAGEFTKYRQPK